MVQVMMGFLSERAILITASGQLDMQLYLFDELSGVDWSLVLRIL